MAQNKQATVKDVREITTVVVSKVVGDASDKILKGMDRMFEAQGKKIELNTKKIDKIGNRLEKVEVDVEFIKRDVKDIKSDISDTPTRKEFSKLETKVDEQNLQA